MREQKEVVGTITSVKADDFKRCHATGFYGGINPLGEFVFEVYEDVVNFPIEFELVKTSSQPELVEQKKDSGIHNITRIRHTEITIPASAIPGIVSWLQSKIIENEKASESEPKE